MQSEDFRRHGHALVEWIASYLEGSERYPVLPRVSPGHVDRRGLGGVRVYCSEHAHSSVDKAMIMLGLGQASLRRIAADEEFRMRPDALREAIDHDRAHGLRPIAVVATV